MSTYCYCCYKDFDMNELVGLCCAYYKYNLNNDMEVFDHESYCFYCKECADMIIAKYPQVENKDKLDV